MNYNDIQVNNWKAIIEIHTCIQRLKYLKFRLKSTNSISEKDVSDFLTYLEKQHSETILQIISNMYLHMTTCNLPYV